MQIHSLKLLNFRIYNSLLLNFSSKLNIIYGKNGSGKTNIVEAIYFLALTKSFKNCHDDTLIKYNKDVCKVEGNVFDNSLNNYKIVLNSKGKVAKINNNIVSKLSDYISKINVVLFQNDDLRIIKDSPAIRRKMMNISLSQTSIAYIQLLADYKKVLKQRNAYLKMLYVNSNESTEYLKILNEKLVNIGIKIYEYRKKKIDYINKNINIYYQRFSQQNDDFLCVKYVSDYENMDKKAILLKMDKNLNHDLYVKKTSFGIHHDDFIFKLNEKDMKLYSSEGQQKNAVIAYKFVEIDWIKSKNNKNPIFILDDLFGELDKEKIMNILNNLSNDIQTFITTTEVELVSKKIKDKSKLFYVDNGKVEEVQNGR